MRLGNVHRAQCAFWCRRFNVRNATILLSLLSQNVEQWMSSQQRKSPRLISNIHINGVRNKIAVALSYFIYHRRFTIHTQIQYNPHIQNTHNNKHFVCIQFAEQHFDRDMIRLPAHAQRLLWLNAVQFGSVIIITVIIS